MITGAFLSMLFPLLGSVSDTYTHKGLIVKHKKRKPLGFPFTLFGGERGIRTPGTSRYGSFQDYCNRPLYHLSSALIVSKAGAKVHVFLETNKFLSKKITFYHKNLENHSLIRTFELRSKVGCTSEIQRKTLFSLVFHSICTTFAA